MHIPLLIAYHTGMRLGEILGLCWQDVDIAAKTLHVRMQIRPGSTGSERYYTTPKTKSSIRTFPIDAALVSELTAWRDMQSRSRQDLGSAYVLNFTAPEEPTVLRSASSEFVASDARVLNLICTKLNGKLPTDRAIRDYLKKDGLNPHSFRHTHATLLISAGASAKGVANRLGHKNIRITQDIYTHDTKKLQDDTLAYFESATKMATK